MKAQKVSKDIFREWRMPALLNKNISKHRTRLLVQGTYGKHSSPYQRHLQSLVLLEPTSNLHVQIISPTFLQIRDSRQMTSTQHARQFSQTSRLNHQLCIKLSNPSSYTPLARAQLARRNFNSIISITFSEIAWRGPTF